MKYLVLLLSLLFSTAVCAVEPFPVPSENSFTSQAITVACQLNCIGDAHVNSSLRVTVSNVTGIPVGTVYSSLGNVYSRQGVGTKFHGPTIINLTNGDHLSVEFSGTVTVDGPAAYFVCAKDGDGNPTTFIHPSDISTVNTFNLNSASSALMVKNCYVGPTASALMSNPQAYRGYRHVVMNLGGTIYLINDVLRNAGYSCVYADDSHEWANRMNASIHMYDTEEKGCGGGPTNHHNTYVHSLKEFWVVHSIMSDTTGAHEVKTDVNKFVFWHSWCLRDTGIGVKTSDVSACMNVDTYAEDTRISGSVVGYNNTVGTNVPLISVVPRGNAGGGFSGKVPPMEDIENDPGLVRSPNGMFAHWKSNNFKPGYSLVNFSGKTAAAAPGGAPSIRVSRIAYEGNAQPIAGSLSAVTQYTVRLRLTNGNVQEFVTTPSAPAGPIVTLPVTAGLCNGVVAPATVCAPGVALNATVAIKPASSPWDYRMPDSRFYNHADPRYFFGKNTRNGIRGVDGSLDLVNKVSLIPTFFAEDNLFYTDSPANSVKMLSQDTSYPEEYTGTQESNRGMMPSPPICMTGGQTPAWPNIAGCGTLAQPMAGAGLPDFGRSPTGFVSPQNPGRVGDFVWFNPLLLADDFMFIVSGNFNTQIQIDPPPAGQYDGGGDVRWLDSGGVLHKIISTSSSMAKSPFSNAQTTITEPAPMGIQNLAVANGTVCSNGQKIMIRTPIKRGTDPLVVTTIDQAPGMNSIHIAVPLPVGIATGAMVACGTAAGARPSWWVSPVNYPDQ